MHTNRDHSVPHVEALSMPVWKQIRKWDGIKQSSENQTKLTSICLLS